MEKILNYIGGEWKPPHSGKYLDNYNPSKGEIYSLIPDSDEHDVNEAVVAAQRAFPAWSQKSPAERGQILRNIGIQIKENLDKFALAESLDNGKPLSLCKSLDIPRGTSNFDAFADAITQFNGEAYKTDTRAINNVIYSPLGVVSIISPWNLPLYTLTWKIAPALAAGNTVIAKPSELTPMTAFLLTQVLKKADMPDGVLNIVFGTGPKVGSAITQHPNIKAISFTGSTATGRIIAQSAAPQFKKISLEMGGKNANIIFADCNFDQAVNMTLRSSFLNQGQVCLCGSRIFIEKSIYEKFKMALVEKTKQLKVGDPLAESTDQGAVVSEAHMNKILSYIDLAKSEGGKILCGGERERLSGAFANGYYVQPTLIENLPATCRTNQEEIFGPVATLIPFETQDEVIEMANSTPYGLSASVWTLNVDKAYRVAERIDAGVVWVNTWMLRDLRTPFGGVKSSGLGREGGKYALEFFSEVKNICIGLNT